MTAAVSCPFVAATRTNRIEEAHQTAADEVIVDQSVLARARQLLRPD